MKLLLHDLQKNLCNGLSDPARPLGAVCVLPLRLVSRLPQPGQRTRRFSHPEASYPVVYRIRTAKDVSDLGFRTSVGPTQLDAVKIWGLTSTFANREAEINLAQRFRSI